MHVIILRIIFKETAIRHRENKIISKYLLIKYSNALDVEENRYQ